jgi:hypothetical protein
VRSASFIIALMMEAVRAFETSVYFNETAGHYNPEGYYIPEPTLICLSLQEKRGDKVLYI